MLKDLEAMIEQPEVSTSMMIDYTLAQVDEWRELNGCVLTSGSRVEGLSNRFSDLDLYVVTLEEGSPSRYQFVARPGYYVDVEFYSVAELERLARSINERSTDDTGWLSSLKPADVDVYYRMSIATAIWGDRPAAMDRFDKERGQAVFAALAAYWARWHLGLADEILAGTSRSEPFERFARETLRSAAEYAMDAHLARAGEGFPSRKWRHEKAARAFGVDAPETRWFWELKTPSARTDAYRQSIDDLLRPLETTAVDWHDLARAQPGARHAAMPGRFEHALAVLRDGLFLLELDEGSAGLLDAAPWPTVREATDRVGRDTLVRLSAAGLLAQPLPYDEAMLAVEGESSDRRFDRYSRVAADRAEGVPAAETLVLESALLEQFALVSARRYDVAGGVAANQRGLLFNTAIDLVAMTLQQLLLRRFGMRAQPRSVAETVYLAARHRSALPPVCGSMLALLERAPITADDLMAFVREVTDKAWQGANLRSVADVRDDDGRTHTDQNELIYMRLVRENMEAAGAISAPSKLTRLFG
jgi:hypothetical protein